MTSQVGGGALPAQDLPSWGLALKPLNMKAHQLERRLRSAPVPVLGRMEQDVLRLDMRTISTDEGPLLLDSLLQALDQPS
jgi:L-seryl-tRNA(Ser) seleniumtransferase